MFIKEVKVRNYQSLYDVTLQLGNFTVVYGNSDVGKSSLYRAIRGLVTCEEGDSFISKGKSSGGVALTLIDSEDAYYNKVITWVKHRSKSSTYYLDSQSIPEAEIVHMKKDWKRCRKLPQMLEDILGFRGVVLDGERFYPNFRGQFERLFFLFESPSKKARMLGVLISNILLHAIKLANVKRNRNEASIRALEELVEGFEQKLQFDWDAVAKEVKTLVVTDNRISKEVDKFDKVHELMYKRKLLRNRLEEAKGLTELLMTIRDALLSYGESRVLSKAVTDIRACRDKLKEQIKAARVDLKLPFSVEKIEKEVDLVFAVMELQQRYNEIKRVEKLSLLPKYRKDLKELGKRVKKMEKELKITCPFCKREFTIGN